jgi:hypothetical protein
MRLGNAAIEMRVERGLGGSKRRGNSPETIYDPCGIEEHWHMRGGESLKARWLWTHSRMERRRRLLVAGVLVLIWGAILLSIATRLAPQVRESIIAGLNDRFKSQVELQSLQGSVFPRPEIVGYGLDLRHNGRRDVAPLISIESFSPARDFWD